MLHFRNRLVKNGKQNRTSPFWIGFEEIENARLVHRNDWGAYRCECTRGHNLIVERATNSCRNPSTGTAKHSTDGITEGANSNTATADATPPSASGRAEIGDASDNARKPDKPDNASVTDGGHDTTAMAITEPGRASPTRFSATVNAANGRSRTRTSSAGANECTTGASSIMP